MTDHHCICVHGFAYWLTDNCLLLNDRGIREGSGERELLLYYCWNVIIVSQQRCTFVLLINCQVGGVFCH